MIDGKIYVPFESVTDMLNLRLDLSEANRIKIYTLNFIVANYKGVIAKLKDYTSMSGDYENLKAMLYGYAVVGDGTNFGVVSLKDGTPIIGVKYKQITFLPNLREFLVEGNNTEGIISENGTPIINPSEYKKVTIFDEENLLYMVQKDDKYGILNRMGEVVIHPEYDEIGFIFYDEKNRHTEYKVIFDKIIPVKSENKYGFYDIEGNELEPCIYDYLGSVISKSEDGTSTNEKPIFLIPPKLGIRGIVLKQGDFYGIYDVTKDSVIIPCVCTKAYSITKSAVTTYYVEHNGEQINLDEYLGMYNFKNIDSYGNEIKQENINTQEQVSNENTSNDSEQTETVPEEVPEVPENQEDVSVETSTEEIVVSP